MDSLAEVCANGAAWDNFPCAASAETPGCTAANGPVRSIDTRVAVSAPSLLSVDCHSVDICTLVVVAGTARDSRADTIGKTAVEAEDCARGDHAGLHSAPRSDPDCALADAWTT